MFVGMVVFSLAMTSDTALEGWAFMLLALALFSVAFWDLDE